MPVFIRDVEVVVDHAPGTDAGRSDAPAPEGSGRVTGEDLQRALEEMEWRRRRLRAD